MSDHPLPVCLPESPGGAVAAPGDSRRLRLNAPPETVAALERALLQSYEQLSELSTLSAQVATLDDPEAIELALLRHAARMLRAGAVFLDRNGCCQRIAVPLAEEPGLDTTAVDVRAALSPHVEVVRRRQRVTLVGPVAALRGAQVLLGALVRPDSETAVVALLRATSDPPFDQGHVLACRSVLAYGAQALSHALLMRTVRQSALETVCALVNAIDAKDNYTSDHSERVGWLARQTGQTLGLAPAELQALEWAGLLHDVGKIGIAEHILNKPGQLTDGEFEQMKSHAQVGYEMLRPVARFAPVLEAVLYHHENHDGSGYPEGRAGAAIPLAARIVHVADIFDALTTCRPYRTRYSLEHAVWVLRQDAGRITDPDVTEAFIATLLRLIREDPHGFDRHFEHLRDAPGREEDELCADDEA